MTEPAKFEKSLLFIVFGILVLFALAIGVTLVAPNYVDSSWIEPSSYYQSQMYEVADPDVYINAAAPGSEVLECVRHIKEGFSLISFEESENLRIIAPKELEKYITPYQEKKLKLTSKLLLLKDADASNAQVQELRKKLQTEWTDNNPDWQESEEQMPYFEIRELYVPGGTEAFAIAENDGVQENWVDKEFEILHEEGKGAAWHKDPGVIFIKNPCEYRVSLVKNGTTTSYQYDSKGKRIENVKELTDKNLGFISRKELIIMGEDIFKIEGCWYCHTDQSRTLVQDCVLNGSDSYPAPPSSANEYIYQEVTFPGTRRIGPDLARVGVKRPSRDWHMSHFWSPVSKSKGSIMPSFHHFFDSDPKKASVNPYGTPNYKFEAIFQYLMTKGTRITPPTQAWWLGLDPIQTMEIIDGRGPFKK